MISVTTVKAPATNPVSEQTKKLSKDLSAGTSSPTFIAAGGQTLSRSLHPQARGFTARAGSRANDQCFHTSSVTIPKMSSQDIHPLFFHNFPVRKHNNQRMIHKPPISELDKYNEQITRRQVSILKQQNRELMKQEKRARTQSLPPGGIFDINSLVPIQEPL